VFFISSETIFPDINDGGTPGPGTVNCPVKYKFLTYKKHQKLINL